MTDVAVCSILVACTDLYSPLVIVDPGCLPPPQLLDICAPVAAAKRKHREERN